MTKKEQIIEMMIAKNPHLAAQRSLIVHELGKILAQVGAVKGDDGYTPKKGMDYFTEAEKQALVAEVAALVRMPKDGNHGRDGTDGEHGITPVRGVDYMHEADMQYMLKRIKPLLPAKAKDGVSPSIDEIVAATKKEFPLVPTQDELVVNLLKHPTLRLLMHGGGGSGSSTTIYTQTPVGAVDGANKTYTVTNTITTVISLIINGMYVHPAEYTVSGAGFTMGTAFDPSLSGTGFTIVYT